MTIADAWGERKSVARSSHADVAATVRPAPAEPKTTLRRVDPDAPAAARSRMSAQDSGAAATHCHAAFVAASPLPGRCRREDRRESARGPREGSAHRRSSRRVESTGRPAGSGRRASHQRPRGGGERRRHLRHGAGVARDPRRGEQPRCRTHGPCGSIVLEVGRAGSRFRGLRRRRAHERRDVRRRRRASSAASRAGCPREHLGRGAARHVRQGAGSGRGRGGERGRPVVLSFGVNFRDFIRIEIRSPENARGDMATPTMTGERRAREERRRRRDGAPPRRPGR